jgi:hypothetical protein
MWTIRQTPRRAAVHPVFAGHEDAPLPDPALVILTCLATFVWTDYEVTGHEDLAP